MKTLLQVNSVGNLLSEIVWRLHQLHHNCC